MSAIVVLSINFNNFKICIRNHNTFILPMFYLKYICCWCAYFLIHSWQLAILSDILLNRIYIFCWNQSIYRSSNLKCLSPKSNENGQIMQMSKSCRLTTWSYLYSMTQLIICQTVYQKVFCLYLLFYPLFLNMRQLNYVMNKWQ